MSFIDSVDFTQPNFSVLTFTLAAIDSGSTDFTLANIQSFTAIDSAVLHASALVNLVPTLGTLSFLFYAALWLALRQRTWAQLTY